MSEREDSMAAKALSNPVRARIYQLISDRDASPVEISRSLGLPVPNVSYHMRALASAGLIEATHTTRRRGAVETHFTARLRPRKRTSGRHMTPNERRIQIAPIVEAVVDGLASPGSIVAGDAASVYWLEAVRWTPEQLEEVQDRLLDWFARARTAEKASFEAGSGLAWYANPILLGIGHPPPGDVALSLVHRRGDEVPVRPHVGISDERAEHSPENHPARIVHLVSDDLFEVLRHPLRIRVFRLLRETGSAKELAAALDEALPNVSYHMRALFDAGLLEVKQRAQRRGAVETYYRAVCTMDITDEEWQALSVADRQKFMLLAQGGATNVLRHITLLGGFDDLGRSVLARRALRLDERAAEGLAEDLMQIHIEVSMLDRADPGPISATYSAALFKMDPMPGRPLEILRHRGMSATPGLVVESDPSSPQNPPPAS